jgi:hypothetical protein
MPLACLLAILAAAPARWVVNPTSVTPDADGSEQKPFRTIAAALARAHQGDTVWLAPGLFTERVVVEKPVTLAGTRSSVIVSPDATGSVVELRASARLVGASIQGGEIGVAARASAVLEEISFSAQRRAAVLAEGVRVEIRGGRVAGLFEKPDLVGVDGDHAELVVRGTRIDGPFEAGARCRAGSMELADVVVEGAQTGVAFIDGCLGEVHGAVIAQGRSVGILVRASPVTVRDTLISRWDHGIEARDGAALHLEDSATAFCVEAAIAVIRSRATIRHHVHAGPATAAAMGIIDSDATIEDGLVIDPGATGIAFHRSRGEVTGTIIHGAKSQAEGDAVYGEKTDDLVLRSPFLEASSGSGARFMGGKARLVGPEIVAAAAGGIVGEKGASLAVEAPTITRTDGAGLIAREGASIKAHFGRIQQTLGGPAAADCDSGAKVELWHTVVSPGVALPKCVTSR